MKAVVLHDYERGPSVEDVTIDAPRPGEVSVRIAASGLCGSDLHLVHGRSNAAFLPAVLGHEGAGVVDEIGAGVTNVEPGDRVIIPMGAPCGSCARCAGGQGHLCESPGRTNRIRGRMADGTSRVHQGDVELFPFVGCGTLAERVVVPAGQLIVVPDDVPFEVAAISACGVYTGLGAVFNIAHVQPGATVLVVGCGGVGLSVVQGCRIAGAARIIAVDANPAKLPLAAQVGATDVIDASREDLTDSVHALEPRGVDVAFEVVGKVELVAAAFELTRQGGVCIATAAYPPGSTVSISPQTLFWDRTLRGCLAGNGVPQRDIPRIMRLYRAGKLDLDVMVSARLPLERVHDALAAVERGAVARAVVMFP
jgi:S-(hydroxymethyl)glutathione dehydrogenase/alcohol dehydrogenase